jgi:hypothetical protein
MKRLALLSMSAAIGLAACSSPEPGSPAFNAELAQKKYEARTDMVQNVTSDLPDWFLKPPADANAVYAAGTATSSDLQMAIDKAVLGAKRSLADRVNSHLSAKMKEFMSETGAAEDAQVMEESQQVTENLVTEVNLAGYTVYKEKIVPANTQYRAYVLLQYPLGEANRLLLDRVKRNNRLQTRLQASKAFRELEKDIQKSRPHPPAPDMPTHPSAHGGQTPAPENAGT